MRCHFCDHDHPRGVWYVPVYPPMEFSFVGQSPDTPPKDQPIYKKWSCQSCGRDHFADGSPFYDPYRTSWTAEDCPCCHDPADVFYRVGDRIHGWKGAAMGKTRTMPPVLVDLNRLQSTPVPRLV